MELLAEATGLKFTFVEAVSREESYVGWIGERVVELREQKKRLMVSILSRLIEVLIRDTQEEDNEGNGGGGSTADWSDNSPRRGELDPVPP